MTCLDHAGQFLADCPLFPNKSCNTLKSMIIDSHTHIAVSGFGGHGKEVTAKDLINSMDEAGIDISLVIANNIPKQPWKGISAAGILKQSANEKRIKAIGCFSTNLPPEEQIPLLEKQISSENIVGVKLYPGYENFFPLDEGLKPVYEICLKYRQPVIFHTGYLMEGAAGDKAQAHPDSLSKLASAYPDLKIVMAHLGNPWTTAAAQAVKEHNNLYVDLSGFFTEDKTISQDEIKDFQKTMATFSKTAGGLAKCIFGTDWPLYRQSEYLQAVQTLDITQEDKKTVFWKTAKKVFSL